MTFVFSGFYELKFDGTEMDQQFAFGKDVRMGSKMYDIGFNFNPKSRVMSYRIISGGETVAKAWAYFGRPVVVRDFNPNSFDSRSAVILVVDNKGLGRELTRDSIQDGGMALLFIVGNFQ